MRSLLITATVCLLAAEAQAAGALTPTLATPARSDVPRWVERELPSQNPPTATLRLPAAVEAIQNECVTGSLLFSEGDCLAVRAYTGSRYTHVAIIVIDDDRCWVYDSMNGIGVRKLPLADYLAVQAPDEVSLLHPRREMSDDEVVLFRAALESQLGRSYSVGHFVTGKEDEGIHCSEYITQCLISIDWLRARNPARVSPASLRDGVLLHHVYDEGSLLAIPPQLEPLPEHDSWCARMWQETTICVGGGCRQLSRWFLCR